ncbi:unnamed protein product [Trichogramma brassicae]|uniref:Uncharacterized protein n=1 Tax=Trichogramma brassicae TaxID=86971 RepID=A0A6H5HZ54_9HYME|nr:unnamed protein product [Trichogramma brassicae]
MKRYELFLALLLSATLGASCCSAEILFNFVKKSDPCPIKCQKIHIRTVQVTCRAAYPELRSAATCRLGCISMALHREIFENSAVSLMMRLDDERPIPNLLALPVHFAAMQSSSGSNGGGSVAATVNPTLGDEPLANWWDTDDYKSTDTTSGVTYKYSIYSKLEVMAIDIIDFFAAAAAVQRRRQVQNLCTQERPVRVAVRAEARGHLQLAPGAGHLRSCPVHSLALSGTGKVQRRSRRRGCSGYCYSSTSTTDQQIYRLSARRGAVTQNTSTQILRRRRHER